MNGVTLAAVVPSGIVTVLAALVVLAAAGPIAAWLIRLRAKRLPADLAERLLEEWLAELDALDARPRKLIFAAAIAFTRTQTFVEAAAGDGAESVALTGAGVVVSVDDVRVYSAFWSRFWALFVDFLLASLAGLLLQRLVDERSVYALFVRFATATAWFSIVQVYLVQRLGGSPGKRLLKMRIVTVDGAPLTYRHCLLRAGPAFIMGVMTTLAVVFVMWQSGTADDPGLTLSQRNDLIVSSMPVWFVVAQTTVQYAWTLGELGAFFSSDERRALHDHIAGTVVILDVPRVVVPLQRL